MTVVFPNLAETNSMLEVKSIEFGEIEQGDFGKIAQRIDPTAISSLWQSHQKSEGQA